MKGFNKTSTEPYGPAVSTDNFVLIFNNFLVLRFLKTRACMRYSTLNRKLNKLKKLLARVVNVSLIY